VTLDLTYGTCQHGAQTKYWRFAELTITNLANGDAPSCGDDLRLAIAQGDHYGGLHIGGTHGHLALIPDSVGSTARHHKNLDGRALFRPPAIVQVVKVTRAALVEDGRITQSEGAIAADGETRRVDGTRLGRLVELELVIGGNVSGAAGRIGDDTTLEFGDEDTVGRASSTLLWNTLEIGCGTWYDAAVE